MIIWALAAGFGSDLRARFIDLVTLLSIVIAPAPAFSKAANRVSSRKDQAD